MSDIDYLKKTKILNDKEKAQRSFDFAKRRREQMEIDLINSEKVKPDKQNEIIENLEVIIASQNIDQVGPANQPNVEGGPANQPNVNQAINPNNEFNIDQNKILINELKILKQLYKSEIEELKINHRNEILEQQQQFKTEFKKLEDKHQIDLKKKQELHCSICNHTFKCVKNFEAHQKSLGHLMKLNELYQKTFISESNVEKKNRKRSNDSLNDFNKIKKAKIREKAGKTDDNESRSRDEGDPQNQPITVLKDINARFDHYFEDHEVKNLEDTFTIYKQEVEITRIEQFIIIQHD
jgi:hypothetical protein